MINKMKKYMAILAAVAVTLSAGQSFAETVLKGAGATFPYPLYSKWFRDYTLVDPVVAFTYDAIGSSGGVKQIMAQAVNFGASDRFLTDEELAAAPGKLLQIPTVMGAVVLSYNIPGLHSELKLTPEAVSAIYLGEISRWNDSRLVALNKELKTIDQKIIVVHRSDGSGTTSIFTDYLSSVSSEWAGKVGKGNTVQWPVGIGGKGSKEMVEHIRTVPFSIAYMENAYTMVNNLPTAVLKNKTGRFVNPTMRSIRAAAVDAIKHVKNDYRVSLVNQAGKDAYPIVGLTWLLVYQEQKDPVKGKALVEFLNWELKKAEKMTSTLFYTPLPEKLGSMVNQVIRSIRY
ncbi:phosphate ABC transporter, periplasmic phosphate-binding protein [Geotalea daltonii FRC-32]|uniref:Phosphate-binding protein n=1 Tax=Geotalea daltonii (strain DSM 22248 / JCM 15807 / FRC-32) TaxID=316067 RepID=B9M880_GEODF|nr:phosphate ABC transporter substrate-binding protein PstS [Geotalea daltonii]ACM20346.1 phosphate ABC transporter, periplasmic phosphate-binding protein [Geotalea daltonii FRC-32]